MFDELTRTRLLEEAGHKAFLLAGTGHRPPKLGGYSFAVADKLRDLAHEVIDRVRPDIIISGMALGWDTALAEAAIERRIHLTAAVPFDGQESRWPEESQDHYGWLLEHADEVVVVSPGDYAVWKMTKRNKWMVERATAIAALWNGTKRGGTWNCIRDARSVDVPIIMMWKTWLEM